MAFGLVRETIVKHMSANKLLCNKQFGFNSGRSTALQLLKVMDEWTKIIDKGTCNTVNRSKRTTKTPTMIYKTLTEK
jgi:hypothetical protein